MADAAVWRTAVTGAIRGQTINYLWYSNFELEVDYNNNYYDNINAESMVLVEQPMLKLALC